MREVGHKFRVRYSVPHITLVGPLYTNDERRLISEFEQVVRKYREVTYRLDGFENFPDSRAIFVDIKPSNGLKELRLELMRTLSPFCQLSEYDNEGDFHFHASIAIKLSPYKFSAIWEYLQKKQPIQKDQFLLRVTILDRNRRILREYDLIQGKMLSRFEALNRTILSKTIDMLRNTKLEAEPKEYTAPFRESQGRIFFISDLHFDHANIIRYCKRPFQSKYEMNEALVRNWNSAVADEDTVYVLGDIAFGRGHHAIDYWLGKLKGKIMFVRGNHDKGIVRRAEELPNGYRLVYKGQEFMLMHDPERPADWKGWIIHGDKHNNNLKDYPFIHGKNKTINISAEVVNYSPVLLDDILKFPLDKSIYVKTVTSKLEEQESTTFISRLMQKLKRLFLSTI
jgi:calcineurin-like phosphoesterase family protein/2'-5' RNA ligase